MSRTLKCHTRLYLIRHGVTAWNEIGRIVGYENLDLSEKGRAQVEGTRHLLAPCRLDLAWTSPLLRTRKTAKIALSSHDVSAQEDQRLIELKLKGWEGRDRQELQDDPLWKAWLAHPDQVSTPEGEKLEDVRKRGISVLSEAITAVPQGGGIAFFTHGGVARVLILHLLGMPLSYYHKIRCDCGSISAFEVSEKGELSRVLALNLTSPSRALKSRFDG